MRSSGIYYDLSKNKCETLQVWGSTGFYTTMRWAIQRGEVHIFFKTKHWSRLQSTEKRLNAGSLDLNFLNEEILFQIQLFCQENPDITTGLARIAILPDGYHFFVYESSIPKNPIKGIILNRLRTTPESKMLHGIEIYEELLKIDRSKEELLLVDAGNYLMEGATSNIIVRTSQAIHLVTQGALPGITQSLLLDTIHDFGEHVINEPFCLDNLSRIKEIICVGSGKEVCSIHEINGIDWQNDGENTLYCQLKKSFNMLKDRDLREK